jgi:CBS domain-containing protein
MYTVPIFDEAKNEVIGKVDINDFFNAISADDTLLEQLSDVVQINSPVTIGSNATVSDTYQLLREEAVSRLVLVNEFNSLEGIISRSDVELAFTRPTPKQRFSTRDGDHNNFSFDEEKKKRNDASIQSLITRSVASIADTTTMKEKITTLIASEHFDLVVTSTDNKPVGIITSRDLLTGIKQLDSEEVAHILLLKPSDTVSDVVVDHAYQFLQNFGKKMGKRDELSRLEVSCEEPRYPSGETAVFNTTLKVLFANGNDYIANTKDSSFLSSVRSAVAQATKQIQRNKVQSSYP